MAKHWIRRLALILVLIFVAIGLSSCVQKVTDERGIEHTTVYGLVVVRTFDNHGFETHQVAYDPATNVCYMVIKRPSGVGLAPYYIVNDQGKLEVAIYGRNYQGN